MSEDKFTPERKAQLEAQLRTTGGPVRKALHGQMAQNHTEIRSISADLEELEADRHKGVLALEVSLNDSRTQMTSFRGTSWKFFSGMGLQIDLYSLGSFTAWGADNSFQEMNDIVPLSSSELIVTTNNSIRRVTDLGRGRISSRFPIETRSEFTGFINAYHFVSNHLVFGFGREMLFRFVPGGGRASIKALDTSKTPLKHLAYDIELGKIYFSSAGKIYEVDWNVSGNQLEAKLIGTTDEIHSMVYSQQQKCLYLVVGDRRKIEVFRPHRIRPLYIGGKTKSLKIPAPIRPYQDFTIRCRIHIEKLRPNKQEYLIFGGYNMPTLTWTPWDLSLNFHWVSTPESHFEPVKLSFPEVLQNQVGKWVTLTVIKQGKNISLCIDKDFLTQTLSEELPFMVLNPGGKQLKPADFFLGHMEDDKGPLPGLPVAGYCIAELRFFRFAFGRELALQPIEKWIVANQFGLPEGLGAYYRLDEMVGHQLDPEKAEMKQVKGMNLVNGLDAIPDYNEAERSDTISTPLYPFQTVYTTDRGITLTTIAQTCEHSGRLFWIENNIQKRSSRIHSGSALGATSTYAIVPIANGRALGVLWKGPGPEQYLEHAINLSRKKLELAHDLLHASRLQAHFEYEWAIQEQEKHMAEFAAFHEQDTTIKEHMDAIKLHVQSVHEQRVQKENAAQELRSQMRTNLNEEKESRNAATANAIREKKAAHRKQAQDAPGLK